VIAAMGIKERARAIMKEHGVPILPGSEGVLSSAEEALETAKDRLSGHPESFGGRRRTRHARRERSRGIARRCWTQAQQEAGAAFSSADVYLEKYIGAPRHIEFQFWPMSTAMWRFSASASAASSGGIRSCWKNRHRRRCAMKCASASWQSCARPSAIGYSNAGTVEFLMDEKGDLYFIEVNARIQVEHPVTEW
jgi:acetyl-CoA carboxylase, biotin carboxylase subunit